MDLTQLSSTKQNLIWIVIIAVIIGVLVGLYLKAGAESFIDIYNEAVVAKGMRGREGFVRNLNTDIVPTKLPVGYVYGNPEMSGPNASHLVLPGLYDVDAGVYNRSPGLVEKIPAIDRDIRPDARMEKMTMDKNFNPYLFASQVENQITTKSFSTLINPSDNVKEERNKLDDMVFARIKENAIPSSNSGVEAEAQAIVGATVPRVSDQFDANETTRMRQQVSKSARVNRDSRIAGAEKIRRSQNASQEHLTMQQDFDSVYAAADLAAASAWRDKVIKGQGVNPI